MYSWGDADTGSWRGDKSYSYDSARKPYLDKLKDDSDDKGGRTYVNRISPDMKLVNPMGKEISSDSENVIIMGIDVTGSMSSWPKEIFDRLPLFYQTLSQYRPDVEFAFCAIGDATCDEFPLQINTFKKELELEEAVNALYPEGGGGGQTTESYELFGYYMLEHCKLPKATSPFLFIYGDEKAYDKVDSNQVKNYIGDTLQGEVSSESIWKGLSQKFNLFFMKKDYHGWSSSSGDDIANYWYNALGKQRVIDLPSSERAVDVAMGIVSRAWGKYGDFKDNMYARHDSKTIGKVEHSIRLIPTDPGDAIGSSKIVGGSKGTESKPLV